MITRITDSAHFLTVKSNMCALSEMRPKVFAKIL